MARVRYIGAESATVPELGRTAEPDQIVEIPDERFEGYACQPSNWEVIEEPKSHASAATAPAGQAAPKPPAKTTAAKSAPQKEG